MGLAAPLNKLGPTYTGNPAHTAYVEFLAAQLKALGLDVARDHYTFTRWDARRVGLSAGPRGGHSKIAVSSYYPYSGETPRPACLANSFTRERSQLRSTTCAAKLPSSSVRSSRGRFRSHCGALRRFGATARSVRQLDHAVERDRQPRNFLTPARWASFSAG